MGFGGRGRRKAQEGNEREISCWPIEGFHHLLKAAIRLSWLQISAFPGLLLICIIQLSKIITITTSGVAMESQGV